MNKKYIIVKRILDLIGSILGLVLLSPLLILVALLIKFKLGSPVIFKQHRPGKHEHIFPLYKFRSMSNARDMNGDLLPDNERLTKFGKFLRKSSIDELPELWNIFVGNMSFIGPRPLSIHYLPYYTIEERKRFLVRPGLSGWAQVNGRNNVPWDERNTLDNEYVDKISILFDTKILFMTVLNVIRQSDVRVRDKDTISNFNVYRMIQEEGDPLLKDRKLEIGSEFEFVDPVNNGEITISEYLKSQTYDDEIISFSGRNAIALIIDDIMAYKDIKRIYMPSYVCVSMVQPFLDRDLIIEYYDVDVINGHITINYDLRDDVDLFLYMDYFGSSSTLNQYSKIINYYKVLGVPIIFDATHSLLNHSNWTVYCDYMVASVRKWFAVASGGIAYKRLGKFRIKPTLPGEQAVLNKIGAMQMKKEYLEGYSDEKYKFLKGFGDFNNSLIRVDKKLCQDNLSLAYMQIQGVTDIIEKRKNNARYLYKHLTTGNGIEFLYPDFDFVENTPLFVPILVENGNRDKLRQYLIEHQIYLPVHWPEQLGNKLNITDIELSLVCDQRYGINEMEHMLDLINKWTGSKLHE